MTLSDLASIGSLVSGAAVLGSLIYLALQVRQTDRNQMAAIRHSRVTRMAGKGRRFLRALFDEFCRCPAQLPHRYARKVPAQSAERTVCDYLAGMTDRYAQDEYLRLFQPYTGV